MPIEKLPKDYSAATVEKIITSLVRRIEVLENAQTVKKIGSLASNAAPLLNIGELGFVRDDNQNLSLVLRADDGRNYRIGALASTGSSVVSSGGTLDHGSLLGLTDDDHTQYVLRSIMTTKGDLLSFSTVVARLGIGTGNTQLLLPDSSETVGLRWGNLVFNNDEIIAVDDEITVV